MDHVYGFRHTGQSESKSKKGECVYRKEPLDDWKIQILDKFQYRLILLFFS